MRVESTRDAHPTPFRDFLVDAVGPVQRSIWGDSTGHFRFSGLPSGVYAVRIRRLGFPTRLDSVRLGSTGVSGEIRLSINTSPLVNCCNTPICM
jgi:hypothetical protein